MTPPEDVGTASLRYRPEFESHLKDSTRSFFESYCNLSGQELDAHLHEIVSTPRKASNQGFAAVLRVHESATVLGRFAHTLASVNGLFWNPLSFTQMRTIR